jgi:hypothetical protein
VAGLTGGLGQAYKNLQYKCISYGGDYVEKLLKYVLLFSHIIFFLLIARFLNSSLEVTFQIASTLHAPSDQSCVLDV